jgi:type II secretory ATPase GspE/PulE/Tfp pilus assembly ATPase PilB-like protein
LLDLGIEPYLISSSLLAVLAQRLVRKVCKECCEEREPTQQELDFLQRDTDNVSVLKLRQGRGCPNCRQTGYRGRVGLFELLAVGDEVRSKIQACASASEIRDIALGRGMKLLRDDGIAKILRGATTVEEVSRVTVRAAM